MRAGYSMVELLLVVVLVGILAGIGFPAFQKAVYSARAGRLIGDLQAVRTAAFQFEVETGEWPPDVGRGLPVELRPYVQDIPAEGPGYIMDWDNWETIVGISVVTTDPALEAALLKLLPSSEGTFVRLSDRYTYLVASSL